MEYEVVQTDGVPDEYRVEGIDYESEGECYVAIFSGPNAKERAEEYAALKSGSGPKMPAEKGEERWPQKSTRAVAGPVLPANGRSRTMDRDSAAFTTGYSAIRSSDPPMNPVVPVDPWADEREQINLHAHVGAGDLRPYILRLIVKVQDVTNEALKAVAIEAQGVSQSHNQRGSDGPCDCSLCRSLAVLQQEHPA